MHCSHSVVVSTPDFESGIVGSNDTMCLCSEIPSGSNFFSEVNAALQQQLQGNARSHCSRTCQTDVFYSLQDWTIFFPAVYETEKSEIDCCEEGYRNFFHIPFLA